MSNFLTKTFSQTTTTQDTIVQTWHPAVTSTSIRYFGHSSDGTLVYSLPDTTIFYSEQDPSIPLFFQYIQQLPGGSTHIETISIEGTDSIDTVTPGYYTYDTVPSTVVSGEPELGWNASARSIASFVGDGYCQFYVPATVSGVVAGLNDIEKSGGSGYIEIAYGWFCLNGYARVCENGSLPTASFPIPYTDASKFVVARKNGVLYYSIDDRVYWAAAATQLAASTTELVMDASLYAAGDSINNAFITNSGNPIENRTSIFTATSSLLAAAKAGAILEGTSTIVLTGTWDDGTDLHAVSTLTADSTLEVNAIFGAGATFTATSSVVPTFVPKTQIYGTFGAFTALLSGRGPYAEVNASFGAMTAQVGSDQFSTPYAYVASSIKPMTCNAHWLTGQTTVDTIMNMRSMTALAADRLWASIDASLVPMMFIPGDFPLDIRDVGSNALITENIESSTSTSYKQIISLLESIIYGSEGTSKITITQVVNDYFTLLDLITLQFNFIISEQFTMSEVLYGLIKQIIEVIEQIRVVTSLTGSVSYKSTISELVTLLDTLLFNRSITVSEAMVLATDLATLQRSYNSLIEAITSTTSNSTTLIRIGFIADSSSFSSSTTTKAIFLSSLLESFLITVPTAKGQDTYLAYLLSPETNSVTNYDNYNFNLCTKFGSKYLFANNSGLYEFGGTTDAGSTVRSVIETIAYSFGDSNKKSVPNIYLGVTNSSTFILKVRVDGKAEVSYKIKKKTTGLDTQKVDIGKGLIGRYFQFELITEADDFKMESIEFFPLFIKRKI